MRKIFKALVLLIMITLITPIQVKAQTIIKINDLIENEKVLDNQEVVIQGEAVGESLKRGDYSWINVNDGTNAIGIWLDNKAAKTILHYGNYKNIGDIVEITGTFHRACTEHGGEADLHVKTIKIIKNGYVVKVEFNNTRIIYSIVFSLIALILFVIFIRINKKELAKQE